jgi:hypothetical protein
MKKISSEIESPVQQTARLLARLLLWINITIYLVFFILARITDDWIEPFNDPVMVMRIAVVTYGSLLTSLSIACFFKVAPANRRDETIAVYALLLLINAIPLAVCLLFGYAFSDGPGFG